MESSNTGLLATLNYVSDIGIVILGVIVVIVAVIGAISSGIFKTIQPFQIKLDGLEKAQGASAQATMDSTAQAPRSSSAAPQAPMPASTHAPRKASASAPTRLPGAPAASSAEEKTIPFETEQLESYYSQVLVQSKISFWFSLVFASIGFLIIVLAAFLHSTTDTNSTIARFIAGGVVDAVAALFFVQSKKAQESMADFFDKLRRDRNHLEARKLCESLESPAAKDALRIRLALHYAEVGSPDAIAESIIKAANSK
jgi:hypothetical protein